MLFETAVAGVVAAGGAIIRGARSPNSPLFGPVVGRGGRDDRVLYLTFDDGPGPTATASILQTLAQEHVPAAFFLLGSRAGEFPELARDASRAGHEIGNHTQHHRSLTWMGPAAIDRELREAHEAISHTCGRVPRAFRAPYGYRNPFVAAAARRLGYTTFGWTHAVPDYRGLSARQIRQQVTAGFCPGAIIVLHDGATGNSPADRGPTAAALPGIIEDARQAGYRFHPLSELLT